MKMALARIFAPERTRLPVVQALRGIAALTVCLHHLNYGLDDANLLNRFLTSNGGLGVYIFFVISGFIVPYSMFSARYKVKNFWEFMKKRMIRVEPSYLASIALSIGLWKISTLLPAFHGENPNISTTQIALHFGYLIPLFPNYHWVSQVYWTLAVEFQFYIYLALSFPLFISRRTSVRLTACLVVASVCLFSTFNRDGFITAFTPCFIMGIALMLKMAGITTNRELAFVTAICSLLSWQTLGPVPALTCAVTVVCILFLKTAPAALLLLGDISYSLYLFHEIVGRRVINLFERFTPVRYHFTLMFAAVFAAIAFAFVMYNLVERPAKKWAARIKYKRENVVSDPLRSSTGAGLMQITQES